MVLLGFNYRLTDIACALGLSQIGKLEANVQRRREIAAAVLPESSMNWRLSRFPAVRDGVKIRAWHLYPIRLNLEALSADRAKIFRALRARRTSA